MSKNSGPIDSQVFTDSTLPQNRQIFVELSESLTQARACTYAPSSLHETPARVISIAKRGFRPFSPKAALEHCPCVVRENVIAG